MDSPADVLSGSTGWFVWNGSDLGPSPVTAVRRVLRLSGARSVAVKTYDGGENYLQPFRLEELREGLHTLGNCRVGAWGYHYGRDIDAEVEQVVRALKMPMCDFVVMNVEDSAIERDPATAVKWATALREIRDAWPHASLYFCSHAQPKYHEKQPYWQAHENDVIQMPMIYHTAMGYPPREAVEIAVGQFLDYGLLTEESTDLALPWSAAGGAYDSPGYNIRGADILEWTEAVIVAGATSVLWWSLDSARNRPDILRAVLRAPTPVSK